MIEVIIVRYKYTLIEIDVLETAYSQKTTSVVLYLPRKKHGVTLQMIEVIIDRYIYTYIDRNRCLGNSQKTTSVVPYLPRKKHRHCNVCDKPGCDKYMQLMNDR